MLTEIYNNRNYIIIIVVILILGYLVYKYWYLPKYPLLTNQPHNQIGAANEPKNTAPQQIEQPSAYWYELDQTCDITDPDGWRSLDGDQANYWFNTPITIQEYQQRRATSTVTEYGDNKHLHPYRLSSE